MHSKTNKILLVFPFAFGIKIAWIKRGQMCKIKEENERDDKILRTTTIDVDPLDYGHIQNKSTGTNGWNGKISDRTQNRHNNYIHKYTEFKKSFTIKM